MPYKRNLLLPRSAGAKLIVPRGAISEKSKGGHGGGGVGHGPPAPQPPPPIPVPTDEYNLGRGQYFATVAMLAPVGSPSNWIDPNTADWPTNTLRGPFFRQGNQWTVWKDAVLARNPALAVGALGVNPPDATLALYDIVTFSDGAGRALVQFNYEALEHLLSMIKFVILQHAVPPKTLARIRGRSAIGTVFLHFLNYEGVNIYEEFTLPRRAMQNVELANLLVGTRLNINGVTHVDTLGASVVTGYAPPMPLPATFSGHFLSPDLRIAGYSPAYIDALAGMDALYAALPYIAYFYDNTLVSFFHGDAQLYYSGTTNQKTYANDPIQGVPNGSEIGAPISNPNPFLYEQYRAGWAVHMDAHRTHFVNAYGTAITNLRARTWGNCYWADQSPPSEYNPSRIAVPYFEFFWGQALAGQAMPTLATVKTYFDRFASEDRPFCIAQVARTADPQVAWVNSTGAGGTYGTWADLLAYMQQKNMTVFAQVARGGTDTWLHFQTGFLPPEGV